MKPSPSRHELTLRARELLLGGDSSGAYAVYEDIMRREPHCMEAAVGRAMALMCARPPNFASALPLLRAAVRQDPHCAPANFQLAVVYHSMGHLVRWPPVCRAVYHSFVALHCMATRVQCLGLSRTLRSGTTLQSSSAWQEA